MESLFLIMRLLHVFLGVFWAGALLFSAAYLIPSIRDAGPDGSKVMAALMRRGYLDVMPVVAVLTIISGFWLYWKLMVTIGPVWAGSMSARVYGMGAVTALIALGLGLIVIRPNGKRILEGMDALATGLEGPEREAIVVRITASRVRMGISAKWVAVLLAITTICMAVARYL